MSTLESSTNAINSNDENRHEYNRNNVTPSLSPSSNLPKRTDQKSSSKAPWAFMTYCVNPKSLAFPLNMALLLMLLTGWSSCSAIMLVYGFAAIGTVSEIASREIGAHVVYNVQSEFASLDYTSSSLINFTRRHGLPHSDSYCEGYSSSMQPSCSKHLFINKLQNIALEPPASLHSRRLPNLFIRWIDGTTLDMFNLNSLEEFDNDSVPTATEFLDADEHDVGARNVRIHLCQSKTGVLNSSFIADHQSGSLSPILPSTLAIFDGEVNCDVALFNQSAESYLSFMTSRTFSPEAAANGNNTNKTLWSFRASTFVYAPQWNRTIADLQNNSISNSSWLQNQEPQVIALHGVSGPWIWSAKMASRYYSGNDKVGPLDPNSQYFIARMMAGLFVQNLGLVLGDAKPAISGFEMYLVTSKNSLASSRRVIAYSNGPVFEFRRLPPNYETIVTSSGEIYPGCFVSMDLLHMACFYNISDHAPYFPLRGEIDPSRSYYQEMPVDTFLGSDTKLVMYFPDDDFISPLKTNLGHAGIIAAVMIVAVGTVRAFALRVILGRIHFIGEEMSKDPFRDPEETRAERNQRKRQETNNSNSNSTSNEMENDDDVFSDSDSESGEDNDDDDHDGKAKDQTVPLEFSTSPSTSGSPADAKNNNGDVIDGKKCGKKRKRQRAVQFVSSASPKQESDRNDDEIQRVRKTRRSRRGHNRAEDKTTMSNKCAGWWSNCRSLCDELLCSFDEIESMVLAFAEFRKLILMIRSFMPTNPSQAQIEELLQKKKNSKKKSVKRDGEITEDVESGSQYEDDRVKVQEFFLRVMRNNQSNNNNVNISDEDEEEEQNSTLSSGKEGANDTVNNNNNNNKEHAVTHTTHLVNNKMGKEPHEEQQQRINKQLLKQMQSDEGNALKHHNDEITREEPKDDKPENNNRIDEKDDKDEQAVLNVPEERDASTNTGELEDEEGEEEAEENQLSSSDKSCASNTTRRTEAVPAPESTNATPPPSPTIVTSNSHQHDNGEMQKPNECSANQNGDQNKNEVQSRESNKSNNSQHLMNAHGASGSFSLPRPVVCVGSSSNVLQQNRDDVSNSRNDAMASINETNNDTLATSEQKTSTGVKSILSSKSRSQKRRLHLEQQQQGSARLSQNAAVAEKDDHNNDNGDNKSPSNVLQGGAAASAAPKRVQFAVAEKGEQTVDDADQKLVSAASPISLPARSSNHDGRDAGGEDIVLFSNQPRADATLLSLIEDEPVVECEAEESRRHKNRESNESDPNGSPPQQPRASSRGKKQDAKDGIKYHRCLVAFVHFFGPLDQEVIEIALGQRTPDGQEIPSVAESNRQLWKKMYRKKKKFVQEAKKNRRMKRASAAKIVDINNNGAQSQNYCSVQPLLPNAEASAFGAGAAQKQQNNNSQQLLFSSLEEQHQNVAARETNANECQDDSNDATDGKESDPASPLLLFSTGEAMCLLCQREGQRLCHHHQQQQQQPASNRFDTDVARTKNNKKKKFKKKTPTSHNKNVNNGGVNNNMFGSPQPEAPLTFTTSSSSSSRSKKKKLLRQQLEEEFEKEHPKIEDLTSSATLKKKLIARSNLIVKTMVRDIIQAIGAHLVEYRNDTFIICLHLTRRPQSLLALRLVHRLMKVSAKISASPLQQSFNQGRHKNISMSVGFTIGEARIVNLFNADSENLLSRPVTILGPCVGIADQVEQKVRSEILSETLQVHHGMYDARRRREKMMRNKRNKKFLQTRQSNRRPPVQLLSSDAENDEVNLERSANKPSKNKTENRKEDPRSEVLDDLLEKSCSCDECLFLRLAHEELNPRYFASTVMLEELNNHDNGRNQKQRPQSKNNENDNNRKMKRKSVLDSSSSSESDRDSSSSDEEGEAKVRLADSNLKDTNSNSIFLRQSKKSSSVNVNAQNQQQHGTVSTTAVALAPLTSTGPFSGSNNVKNNSKNQVNPKNGEAVPISCSFDEPFADLARAGQNDDATVIPTPSRNIISTDQQNALPNTYKNGNDANSTILPDLSHSYYYNHRRELEAREQRLVRRLTHVIGYVIVDVLDTVPNILILDDRAFATITRNVRSSSRAGTCNNKKNSKNNGGDNPKVVLEVGRILATISQEGFLDSLNFDDSSFY